MKSWVVGHPRLGFPLLEILKGIWKVSGSCYISISYYACTSTLCWVLQGAHTLKNHTHEKSHTPKKSLRVVFLKVWPEDPGDPQDSFRGFARSFLNTCLCEAQFSSYTSTSKTYCNRFNVDADLRIWLYLLL